MRWLKDEYIGGIRFKVQRYSFGETFEYHFKTYSDELGLNFKIPAKNKEQAIREVENKVGILNVDIPESVDVPKEVI